MLRLMELPFFQVTLDVYSFLLFLGNALSRPRSDSERLMSIMYRDGIIFFLVRTIRHFPFEACG